MGTAFVRKGQVRKWLFEPGETLILCRRKYVVESRIGAGAFGEVYTVLPCDGSRISRIAKFLRNFDEFHHNESPQSAAEISDHLMKMFRREGDHLKKMASAYPKCFPAFYGSGTYQDHAFYLMEQLSPVKEADLRLLDTDEKRMRLIAGLCRAVGALHRERLVHFDIKPSNILVRSSTGEYVLGDFGSVHAEETHKKESAPARQTELTMSILSDGRRMTPRTVGYCDPIDSRHTRHADIYAIGQVIRDMFAEDVPALWSRIILKCINRNFGQRYNAAEEVLSDVMGMGGDGASRLTREISSMLSPGGSAWLRDRKTIHVSAAAAPRGDGSEERPYKSISAALQKAGPDSAILVQAGEYRETLRIEGRRIDLVAVDGPQKTLIRGKRGFAVVRITDGADGSLVRGFAITGGTGVARKSSYGHDYYGGGINANVSATIEDCVIAGNGQGAARKNACTFGGGACVSDATVTFRNCRIAGNYAWASGGGLMADGRGAALVLDSCTVEKNGSTDFFGIQGGIGLANSATLSVSRCVLTGNSGDQIGAYGNAHANGTRAQVDRSYVQGGAKACNIPLFIARPDNFRTLPKGKGACGCESAISTSLIYSQSERNERDAGRDCRRHRRVSIRVP